MSSRSSSSSSSSSRSSSRRPRTSRFAASSTSSAYYTSYHDVPMKQSKSVSFIAWVAGAPHRSTTIKKVSREPMDFRSSSSISSRGGYGSEEDAEYFWVRDTPNGHPRSSSRSSAASSRRATPSRGRPIAAQAVPGPAPQFAQNAQRRPPQPTTMPQGAMPRTGGVPPMAAGGPAAGRVPPMGRPGPGPGYQGAPPRPMPPGGVRPGMAAPPQRQG